MESSLLDKFAFVSGASRGIGREIAIDLARNGAAVGVHYGRGHDEAQQTAYHIRSTGGKAFVVGADLTSPAEIEKMFEVVAMEMGQLGFDKIDILVNNAGVGGGGNLEALTAEFLDKLYATNVRAPFLVTKAALALLSDGGRVINTSSMVGLAAYPGSIGYAATKAAVNSFTLSLAADLGSRGITVNAVAPGATETDFIREYLEEPKFKSYFANAAALGRLGQPSDIAKVVSFLASDAGGWITGQVIQASGGMHL